MANIRDDKDLIATYIGRGKENLDVVDSDLGIAEVVGMFGPFAKFLVKNLIHLLPPQVQVW